MMVRLGDQLGQMLAEKANVDPRIFVLDGDLADSDGAWPFAEQHPERFLMAGIAEQNMVSMAAGMATTGARPWVYSFAAFLCYRALDQIRIGLSQSGMPVTLVGSHAGGLAGRNGKSHAAPHDVTTMLSQPGIDIWAPADTQDLAFALAAIGASPRPNYIRLPRTPLPHDASLSEASGLLRWIRAPQPLTIISTGLASHWAVEALTELEHLGYPIGHLHLVCIRPLPDLTDALDEVEHVVVIEDHCQIGGLTTLLLHQTLHVRVTGMGWAHDFVGRSGSDEDIRDFGGLSKDHIVQTLQRYYDLHVKG